MQEMRKLTFKTYLKDYLSDVSGLKSLSIHRLIKAAEDNVRIIDPLVLYCLLNNKMKVFSKYFVDKKYDDLKELTSSNFLDEKYGHYSFKKIYQSYERRANVISFDNQTKSLIRNNILLMMRNKQISKYRIYTDLKLNPGNVNDFLKNDNHKKLSLDIVKKIYTYCSLF